jgi:enoyl-CoA hydratase
MTGEMINAQQAMDLGLVCKIFPPDQLRGETMKAAKEMATKGQAALCLMKHVIDRGMNMDLDNGCALEAEAFGMCFASQDVKEGVSAFLEKRKPQFKGSLSD